MYRRKRGRERAAVLDMLCSMVFKSLSLLPQRLCKADFQTAIQQAKRFEELENLYEKNLQLIRQARRAIFYKRSFL
jgi:hypothetical protein